MTTPTAHSNLSDTRGNRLGIGFFKVCMRLFGLRFCCLFVWFVAFFYALFDRKAFQAAKPYLQKELRGEGPMLSPGYLLNVVFECLGWKGSAFMQFTETVRSSLPVVSSNGYVLENGVLSGSPSDEARALLREYSYVQFYLRDSFRS